MMLYTRQSVYLGSYERYMFNRAALNIINWNGTNDNIIIERHAETGGRADGHGQADRHTEGRAGRQMGKEIVFFVNGDSWAIDLIKHSTSYNKRFIFAKYSCTLLFNKRNLDAFYRLIIINVKMNSMPT